MKIMVTGAAGMLGSRLTKLLGDNAVSFTRSQLDITDPDAVMQAVARSKPGLVINAAAYTDVDGAESNRGRAFAVNADGPAHIARACAAIAAFCLHISTDFVFNGETDRPYRESDAPAPISAYSESKLAGEQNVMEYPNAAIARTAWVYGAGFQTFLSQILDRARSGEKLKVVTDQTGSPTWVRDLAEALIHFSQHPAPGIFHVAGGGAATRFEFARAIVEAAGLDPACVSPVATDDFPARPARRPRYSVLEPAAWIAAGYKPLRDWRDALREAIAEF